MKSSSFLSNVVSLPKQKIVCCSVTLCTIRGHSFRGNRSSYSSKARKVPSVSRSQSVCELSSEERSMNDKVSHPPTPPHLFHSRGSFS